MSGKEHLYFSTVCGDRSSNVNVTNFDWAKADTFLRRTTSAMTWTIDAAALRLISCRGNHESNHGPALMVCVPDSDKLHRIDD